MLPEMHRSEQENQGREEASRMSADASGTVSALAGT